MPNNLIGIPVEKWPWKKVNKATKWLRNAYGDEGYPIWYMDYEPMCTDLVMRKDVYFMFLTAFGEEFVNGD